MGVERNAFLGRGVILTAPPRELVTVPSCDHPEREGNQFCPKCGTAVRDKKEYANTALGDRFEDLKETFWEETNFPKGLNYCVIDAYGEGRRHFLGVYISTIDEPTEAAAAEIMGTPFPDIFRMVEQVLVDYPEFIEGLEVKTIFGMRYS